MTKRIDHVAEATTWLVSDQYVLLEFNQASRQPRLMSDEIYSNFADAVQDAEGHLEETRQIGRRERYAVASIDIEWDSDDEARDETA